MQTRVAFGGLSERLSETLLPRQAAGPVQSVERLTAEQELAGLLPGT